MRNTLHYVIGAMLIYLIGFATDMHTYDNNKARFWSFCSFNAFLSNSWLDVRRNPKVFHKRKQN
jgi:hypothetical protein